MAGQLYLRPVVHPACRHVSWHLPCLTCITKVLSPSGGPWCALLRALLTQWICLNWFETLCSVGEGRCGCRPVCQFHPDASAGKDAIVDAATRNVFAQMDSDRKTTALKSLQASAQGTPSRK